MAACSEAVHADDSAAACSGRHQLQRSHQLLREGTAMAKSPALLQHYEPTICEARCGQLQCCSECLSEALAMGAWVLTWFVLSLGALSWLQLVQKSGYTTSKTGHFTVTRKIGINDETLEPIQRL